MNDIEREELTPLMRQYYDIKQQYAEALLFFQVGDFYELFFDDAIKASSFLAIALTKRGTYKGEPIPLCGVPVHTCDHYVAKLVSGGFKVALCSQLEEARPGAIVKRGVTQVLTPGTLTDVKLLDAKSASYLFSFFPMPHACGCVFAELLSAHLYATEVPADAEKVLESELVRFVPDEIIIPQEAAGYSSFFKNRGYVASVVDQQIRQAAPEQLLEKWFLKQFSRETIDHVHAHDALRNALYYFYLYIRRNQEAALEEFRNIQFYEPEQFLVFDAPTARTLELVSNNNDKSSLHSLWWAVDGAVTPMGSRCIKKWLLSPLVDKEALEQRYDVVSSFVSSVALMHDLEQRLQKMHDFERLIGKIALNKASVHDYLLLIDALEALPLIRAQLEPYAQVYLVRLFIEHLNEFASLHAFLRSSINDDEKKEWFIKKGFDQVLDQMRDLVEHAQEKVLELEQKEQERSGISTLKIRYNQVAGYYIEVTKSHAEKVPSDYQRLQTLAGKERFTVAALQDLERNLMRAHTDVVVREKELCAQVHAQFMQQVPLLRRAANALARLDALLGFARIAYFHRYVRPSLVLSRDVEIKGGRHPVVERTADHAFIPNDLVLNDQQSLLMITGPNMGGKSTFLRQAALMSIMAQAGSFVPAQSAQLPLFDRIFTRIGSGDNLAAGKSTFLVEMEETAAICRYATPQSLVILDEVGRGTSTFDGLAIAHAVVEYIVKQVRARCLFATHYHELTRLEHELPGVVSYFAASTRTAQGVTFLYAMTRGVADGSYGVEVAKLAQLPASVIERAQVLLHDLTIAGEQVHQVMRIKPASLDNQPSSEAVQQQLAMVKEELAFYRRVLEGIDLNELSPRQALELVWKLAEK